MITRTYREETCDNNNSSVMILCIYYTLAVLSVTVTSTIRSASKPVTPVACIQTESKPVVPSIVLYMSFVNETVASVRDIINIPRLK